MLIFPDVYRPDVYLSSDLDLVDVVSSIEWLETDTKDRVPLFVPARLGPTAPLSRALADDYVSTKRANRTGETKTPGARKNQHIEALTHLALDFDSLNNEQAAETLRLLESCSGATWSTWSWGIKPGWRFRAVLRLTEEVPAAEWRRAFEQALRVFRFADACKDECRGMYLPSCPPGASRWRVELSGSPLSLRGVPVAPTTQINAFTEPIPVKLLQSLRTKWWRSQDIRKADLASRLQMLIDGAAFAEYPNRDNTTFALVCAIVADLDNVSCDSLMATFRPSLELMGEPPIEKLADMFERAKQYKLDAPIIENAQHQAEVSASVVGRLPSTMLTYLHGMNMPDPLKALVFQRDSDYWVFAPSVEEGFGYVPCKLESLSKQCQDKWATLSIPLFTSGDKPRKMKAPEIVEQYGSPVEDVVLSYEVQEPGIRRKGARRILILPAASRDAGLEPEYHPHIDEWLSLMCGASAETLRDWLVLALDTTKPLASLMLIGADSTGKSLLAKGLSQIWTDEDPPKLERILGDSQKNEDIKRCPVVLADEDLPRDFRGRVRSAEIRDFVQRGRHQVDIKYKTLLHLEGYLRLIGTGNGERILDFGHDQLTPEDLAAIRKRLFVIRVNQQSASYLAKMPVRTWLEHKAIARHVLWLEANRFVEYKGRFGIETGDSYSHAFIYAQGIRSLILEWLVRFLLRPTQGVRAAAVDDVLAVRLADIEAQWISFSNARRPSVSALANAAKVFPRSGDGKLVVSLQELTQWCKATNYSTETEINEAFAAFRDGQSEKGLRVVR